MRVTDDASVVILSGGKQTLGFVIDLRSGTKAGVPARAGHARDRPARRHSRGDAPWVRRNRLAK
jgi:hypothetical protein